MVLSLFCKVGPGWQLSSAWARLPPLPPLALGLEVMMGRKGLTGAVFFHYCESQWKKSTAPQNRTITEWFGLAGP